VKKGRVPTPKLNQRGRRIFLLIAGGVLATTLVLHFWYFPRFREQQPSRDVPLATQGIVKEKERLKEP
jgi:hypothetical protein